jgi:hypothetical protein
LGVHRRGQRASARVGGGGGGFSCPPPTGRAPGEAWEALVFRGRMVVWRCSSVMARYRGRRGRLDDVQETENRLLDLLGPAASWEEAWFSRTERRLGGGLWGECRRWARTRKRDTR